MNNNILVTEEAVQMIRVCFVNRECENPTVRIYYDTGMGSLALCWCGVSRNDAIHEEGEVTFVIDKDLLEATGTIVIGLDDDGFRIFQASPADELAGIMRYGALAERDAVIEKARTAIL